MLSTANEVSFHQRPTGLLWGRLEGTPKACVALQSHSIGHICLERTWSIGPSRDEKAPRSRGQLWPQSFEYSVFKPVSCAAVRTKTKTVWTDLHVPVSETVWPSRLFYQLDGIVDRPKHLQVSALTWVVLWSHSSKLASYWNGAVIHFTYPSCNQITKAEFFLVEFFHYNFTKSCGVRQGYRFHVFISVLSLRWLWW